MALFFLFGLIAQILYSSSIPKINLQNHFIE